MNYAADATRPDEPEPATVPIRPTTPDAPEHLPQQWTTGPGGSEWPDPRPEPPGAKSAGPEPAADLEPFPWIPDPDRPATVRATAPVPPPGRVTPGVPGDGPDMTGGWVPHGPLEPDNAPWDLRADHILLTGVTGFLGQAILERILATRPGTRVTVLIRARGSTSGATRLASLARKPVFRTLRERIGSPGVTAVLAQRVRVLEGDLTGGLPPLPQDLTAVIHCASSVSFDPPIDEAFQANVTAVAELYEAVSALPRPPHVVHVSTAYVSAARHGAIPEASLEHDVDWRTERDLAMAARAGVELDSRRPEFLRAVLHRARAEHAKAGPQTAARAAEQLRREEVEKRLVDHGRLRAQSLGWSDVYTMTKALSERVAEEYARRSDLSVSVVRPAIVQSALRDPFPGWFESYKMMDPIILAYGRGSLPDFPGLPDGVVDVIPVDLVTNATLAITASPPPAGQPAYYHLGTGARNPLTVRQLQDHMVRYFRRHPLPDAGRGHVLVHHSDFPGARRVERMLRTGEQALSLAERGLRYLPSSARTRQWTQKVHAETQRLETLRRLADLYGVYGEVEAIYSDAHTIDLHRTLPSHLVGSHGFDVSTIDWGHYLCDVHWPAITALSRQSTTRRAPTRRRPALAPGAGTVAVFDLEGTVIASNLIESFLWTRLIDRPRSGWVGEIAALAGAAPRYLRADGRSRSEFIRTFMRRYAGESEERLRRLIAERIGDALLCRALPEAVRQIRAHRAAGHRTILVTGTADVLVEPLAPLFDEIVASRLHVRDGVLTGFLAAPPLVGEARVAWLRQYAAAGQVDLARSFAYGDSYSDRPLLEAVGHPVAVNPDTRLLRHARSRRWHTEHWGTHTRGPVEALLEAAGTVHLTRGR